MFIQQELHKTNKKQGELNQNLNLEMRESWHQNKEGVDSNFHLIWTKFRQNEQIKCGKNTMKRQKHQRSIKNWWKLSEMDQNSKGKVEEHGAKTV